MRVAIDWSPGHTSKSNWYKDRTIEYFVISRESKIIVHWFQLKRKCGSHSSPLGELIWEVLEHLCKKEMLTTCPAFIFLPWRYILERNVFFAGSSIG